MKSELDKYFAILMAGAIAVAAMIFIPGRADSYILVALAIASSLAGTGPKLGGKI